MKTWRQQLEELGGWDNVFVPVPSGAVRKLIEELEATQAELATNEIVLMEAERNDKALREEVERLGGAMKQQEPVGTRAGMRRSDLCASEMRQMLSAMQAGELTVSRGVELLDMWLAGNYSDDQLPPVRQDLIELDALPVEIIDRLKAELAAMTADRDSWERQASDRADDVIQVGNTYRDHLAAKDARIAKLCAELAALKQQEPVFAFRRKGLDDFCTCSKERYNKFARKPSLFEVATFYLAPQPSPQVVEPVFVGLTEDDCEQLAKRFAVVISPTIASPELCFLRGLRAAEKKLQEKNTSAAPSEDARDANGEVLGMKPHVFRELINELRDTAIKYHDHQSLRERLSGVIRAALQKGGA